MAAHMFTMYEGKCWSGEAKRLKHAGCDHTKHISGAEQDVFSVLFCFSYCELKIYLFLVEVLGSVVLDAQQDGA